MFENCRSRLVSSSSISNLHNFEAHEALLNELDDFDSITTNVTKKTSLLVYWVYFLYGMAMLLPWNVFITASSYFFERFTGSSHQQDFQNYFSAYSNCSNLISLAILLWLQQRKITTQIDVAIPLLINFFTLFLFSLTLPMPTISATPYFYLSVGCMVLMGATTSLLQQSVFANASQLPSIYTQAVMSGQGVAGVSVAAVSLLTTIIENDSKSAFFYFIAAAATTLFAIVGRIVMYNDALYFAMLRTTTADDIISMTTTDEGDNIGSTMTVPPIHHASMWDIIFKLSTKYICTIIYIYIITLALFPSVTTQIKSVNGMPTPIFISLHFLLFNIGDWIGRLMPLWKFLQVYSSNTLWVLSFSRTLFIPLFLNCNMTGQEVIHSDLLFFISVLLFAISNGWLTSLVFMGAPAPYAMSVKPMVGSVMSFFLVVGLALGGLFSFFISTSYL